MTLAPLRSQAEQLATGGEWTALYGLLREEAPESLATDSALAYRFGEALYHTGRMEELASFAEVYERRSRESADPLGTQHALNLAGIAAFELGRIITAQEKFDALMELAEAEGDEEMLARAANNLGAIANLRGRRHEALAYYHLAIPLYQKLGQARGLAQTHHNLGLSYRDLRRLEDAVTSYIQAAALAEGLRYRPLVAMATVGRAEAELLRGDAELAGELAARGLAAARAVPDPVSEAEGLRVQGLAKAEGGGLSAVGEPATRSEGEQRESGEGLRAAMEDLAAALRLARRVGHTLIEAEALRDLGRVAGRLGQTKEARRRLEQAAAGFESLGAIAEARAVREELGSAS
ncbi:MAG: tetratricopeptide repeat protein [Gemmatimonadota bacterium]